MVTYGTAAIARTTPVTTTLHPNVTLVVIRNATTANARGIAQGGDQVLQYWDGFYISAYSPRRTQVIYSNIGPGG